MVLAWKKFQVSEAFIFDEIPSVCALLPNISASARERAITEIRRAIFLFLLSPTDFPRPPPCACSSCPIWCSTSCWTACTQWLMSPSERRWGGDVSNSPTWAGGVWFGAGGWGLWKIPSAARYRPPCTFGLSIVRRGRAAPESHADRHRGPADASRMSGAAHAESPFPATQVRRAGGPSQAG